jgi:hypothetical protein
MTNSNATMGDYPKRPLLILGSRVPINRKRPGIPSGEGIGSGMKIASWFILGMWIQGVEYAGGGR